MLNNVQNISWPDWETVRLIGRGSFGSVYEIQRDVVGEIEKAALKVISIPQDVRDIEEMSNDGYDDESITATFNEHLKSIVAEYSLMRKIGDCVNVVRCDDIRYIQHDNGIGWDIFIKMELLTPITKALPSTIPEDTVIKLGKDICKALIACKENNVIHRDIKPQNIFVSQKGDYKLGDFGIAKTIERTSSGTKIGTYKYMAPEVFNNQPYGAAADIYSLGLVLYWMLNNRRMPFLPSTSQVVTANMEEDARTRRFSGENIPNPAHGSAKLKTIVLKACAFDVAQRYQTAQEMLNDLQALMEPKPVFTPPPVQKSMDVPPANTVPIRRNEPVISSHSASKIAEPAKTSVMNVPPANTVPIRRNEPVKSTHSASKIIEPAKTSANAKSKQVALILAVIPYTGWFAIHDLYLGKKFSQIILKMITMNFCLVGWIWDIIQLLSGEYKDANGECLK